jgi:antirestriction protein ArdC
MSVYQEVTDQIIAQLEAGAAPWIKPWSGSPTGADRNYISGKPYKGINRILLAMSGHQTPLWATFNQWADKGGKVRKGEKGTRITLYKPISITDKDSGEERAVPLLRTFTVFNAEQVDGIEFAAPAVLAEPERREACEAYIAKTGATIRHGGDRACFIPSADIIQMPLLKDFNTPEHYYATAFHELVHWTGHEHRLDRNLKGKFGNSDYAFEELVAEMGAAMVCADHQVQGDLRHAGYIQSWLKCLKDDSKAIFKAAALAEKAATFLNECSTEPLALAA